MRWTLVTGAAKGLGAEICRQLARQKLAVAIHYRASQKEAEEIAMDCRNQGSVAEIIQGDFSTLESTLSFANACIEKFKNIENLVNNVGNYAIGSASATSLVIWQQLYQTNFHAPLALIQKLLPSLKETAGGIVNIGTVGVDDVRADTYSTAYRSSKLSLWMLTKSLAKELAPYHIHVNMVSPGYLENSIDLPKEMQQLPMGRTAALSEVAALVCYLLSPAGKYITGQNIEVAGGVKL